MKFPYLIRRQSHVRPLATFSICFFLGILIGDSYNLPLHVMLVGGAICLIAMIILRRMGKRMLLPVFILAVLLGTLRFEAGLWFYTPVEDMKGAQFEGVVTSEPYYKASSDRLVCRFHVDQINGTPEDADIQLYFYSYELPLEGIEYGQTLRCTGSLWPQTHSTNPYEFDSLNWLLSDGLDGMASVDLQEVEILETGKDLNTLRISFRNAISRRIDQFFPDNAGLVKAFVLGDRTSISSDLRESFSKTGIAHLIAVSGMHITVLVMLLSFLFDRFLHRDISIGITIIFVLFYGWVIGFPPSLIRATITYTVLRLSPVFGRPSDPLTRLGLAFLCMLVYRPFFIYDGGFVLSFTATLGIILLTPVLESLFCIDKLREQKPRTGSSFSRLFRMCLYFPQLMCTTLASQLTTLPFIIAYFGAQSPLSLPVNLIAIPLAMLAYPMAIIALLLSSFVMPVGAAVAYPSNLLFKLLSELAQFFSSIDLVRIHIPRFPTGMLILYFAVIVASSNLCRIKIALRKWFPFLLVTVTGFSMLIVWSQNLGFQAIFLDAGQGDAAVIKTEGRVYAFDVGDSYTPVTDYLSATSLGVDAVFLTHPHKDHAAGLSDLLSVIPPKAIYVPKGWFDAEADGAVSLAMEEAERMGIPIIELDSGDTLSLSDNTSVHIYRSKDPSDNVNDTSMISEIVYKNKSILITGDLSTKNEPSTLPDIDVLKVPHHGSKHSTSEHLLEMTSPEIGVISVGRNSYGHPTEETLNRLAQANVDVLRTDRCGAIFISVSQEGNLYYKTTISQDESHAME